MEKKNEAGKWGVVKGRNPRIDNYREYAKTAYERGDLERAAQLQLEASDIESGVAAEKFLEKIEEWYPKAEREKDPDLMVEYKQELASGEDFESPERINDWIYDGRNYDLFAILANVRNGYGFAGVDTGDGFNPIAMPKGIPSNVSKVVRQEAERWGDDGHSHSYLTVKELLDFNWNQTTTQRGVVSEKEYIMFKEKGVPEYYAGGVGGANIIHITPDEMELLIKGAFPRQEGKEYFTSISWNEFYYKSVGSFYTKSLPILKELAQDELESVRIVFFH